MNTVYKFLATAMGFGYSPFAPGTAGTLIGIVLLYPIYLWQPELPYFSWGLIIATVIFYFVGVYCADQLEPEWGNDPSKIVLDEVIGVWITVLFIPITLQWMILAFILFRFFDILKPLGIRKLDNIKNGHGVMLDDVLAGIYANIVLQIIVYFFPQGII